MMLRNVHLKYNINVQPTKFYFSDVKWHPLQPVKYKFIYHVLHIFGNKVVKKALAHVRSHALKAP